MKGRSRGKEEPKGGNGKDRKIREEKGREG